MYNSKAPSRTIKHLRGIFLFFKVFGFLPYSESTSTNTGLILYSILKICFLSLSLKKNLLHSRFSFYLTELVMYIVYGGLLVGYVVFILESFFYRKVLYTFYKKYDSLEETHLPGNYSNKRLFDLRFKMGIFIILMFFISDQILREGLHIEAHGILTMTFSYHGIARCAQFVVHVELIYIKLSDLYEQLNFLKENEMTFKLYNKFHPNLLGTKLENCRESYGKIYELVLDVNLCFGWSILSIIVQLFYTLTSDAYWTWMVVMNGFPGTVFCE